MKNIYTLHKEIEKLPQSIKIKNKKIFSRSYPAEKKLFTVNKATNVYKKAKSQYYLEIPAKEKTQIQIENYIKRSNKKYFIFTTSVKTMRVKPQIKIYWQIKETIKKEK